MNASTTEKATKPKTLTHHCKMQRGVQKARNATPLSTSPFTYGLKESSSKTRIVNS